MVSELELFNLKCYKCKTKEVNKKYKMCVVCQQVYCEKCFDNYKKNICKKCEKSEEFKQYF